MKYRKVYKRLKTRKQRRKISKGDWSAAVAKAQVLVAKSERGELIGGNLKQKLEEL